MANLFISATSGIGQFTMYFVGINKTIRLHLYSLFKYSSDTPYDFNSAQPCSSPFHLRLTNLQSTVSYADDTASLNDILRWLGDILGYPMLCTQADVPTLPWSPEGVLCLNEVLPVIAAMSCVNTFVQVCTLEIDAETILLQNFCSLRTKQT